MTKPQVLFDPKQQIRVPIESNHWAHTLKLLFKMQPQNFFSRTYFPGSLFILSTKYDLPMNTNLELRMIFRLIWEHVSKLDKGTTTWSVCKLPWAVWITEFGFPTKITLPLVSTGSWLFADWITDCWLLCITDWPWKHTKIKHKLQDVPIQFQILKRSIIIRKYRTGWILDWTK